MNKYKKALEEMVWQFAYRGVKRRAPVLHTGGLSALEGAFEALGWDDPHYVEDFDGGICDVDGCPEWVVAQGGSWVDTGYWCLCRDHCQQARGGKAQPVMKLRAINRENSRGEDGCLPVKAVEPGSYNKARGVLSENKSEDSFQ